MPDWLTHILIAIVVIELLSLRYEQAKEYRFFVLFGSILPDIGNFTILFGKSGERIKPFFEALHTPFGFLILAALIVYLTRKEWRKVIFYLVALGGMLHFIADMLIITLNGKIMVLYPLSLNKYSIGVFRQGEFIFLITAAIIALITLLASRIYRKYTGLSYCQSSR